MQNHTHIKSKTNLFDLNLKELFQYKDLIYLFFNRTYSTRYKQTILGPLWLIINPMLTVTLQAIVFGGFAGFSTAGVPKIVFYLCSNTIWSFFATCVKTTANTLDNVGIMGKIYFPRLVMPLASVLVALFDFVIHMGLLVVAILVYSLIGYQYVPSRLILLAPVFVLQVAILGLGIGIIVASLTTKYRDLKVLIDFGLNLWMYASPVVYTLSIVTSKYLRLYLLNPMAVMVDGFRSVVLNIGTPFWKYWGVSWVVTICFAISISLQSLHRIHKGFFDLVKYNHTDKQ